MSEQQSIRAVFLVVVACAFAQGRPGTVAGSRYASLDSLKAHAKDSQEPSEPVYFELDGRTLKAGLSLLEVSITDLNRRTSISKSVIF